MKNFKRVITWVLVCSIMFTNLPNLQNSVYALEKEKTISKPAPLFDIYPYFDEDTKELLVIWDEMENVNTNVYLRFDDNNEFEEPLFIGDNVDFSVDIDSFKKSVDITISHVDSSGNEYYSYIISMEKDKEKFNKIVIDTDKE